MRRYGAARLNASIAAARPPTGTRIVKKPRLARGNGGIDEFAEVNRRASKACAPMPARGAHGLQVIEMRLPFEQRTGTIGSRHDLCGVASPPAGERDLEVDARDPLYRLDYLEHGKTPAVTAIERGGAHPPLMALSISAREFTVLLW